MNASSVNRRERETGLRGGRNEKTHCWACVSQICHTRWIVMPALTSERVVSNSQTWTLMIQRDQRTGGRCLRSAYDAETVSDGGPIDT